MSNLAKALFQTQTYLNPAFLQELFVDPVLVADGFTYERSAIEDWLSRRAISPMTNAPLFHTALVPNLAVREAALALRENCPF